MSRTTMRKVSREAVEQLLEAKALSQARLAKLAGITPKTLTNVLNGNSYRRDTLALIAEVLNVEPDDLLEGSTPSAATAASRQITIQVVLGLPIEMAETSEGVSNLLSQVSTLMHAIGTLSVSGLEEGSIKLTLKMCEEDARSLVVAAFNGHLEELAFISLTVLDEDFEMPLTLPHAIDLEIIEEKKAYIRRMMRKKPGKRKTKQADSENDPFDKIKKAAESEKRLRETLRKLSEGEELDTKAKRKPNATGDS
ncbi:MAG: helix-turn-helix transcriptional regulator [Planctomyces sp.]|nr:helix-turn-helix transcriptional regulator [Planctomyces sp.]